MFSNAKWIAHKDTMENVPAPHFRKEFLLKEKPCQATLKICGLGLYSATINGKPVSDEVLAPPVSRFDKTVYYNEYDVASLLAKGLNCIGVMLGNGWYNYPSGYVWDFEKADWRHHPKLIACLVAKYVDGNEEAIVTDTTWQAGEGPLLYNLTREGEDYDARLFAEGWDLAGFDSTGWENAFICFPPGGILKKASCPPIRIVKTWEPKRISDNGAAGRVYDFGQNMSGWVKIDVKGEAGSEAVIRYADCLNDNGTINMDDVRRFSDSGRVHCCKYILAGKAEGESWHPVFTYYGFRYAEITVKGKAEVLKAEAQELHTDLALLGSFECGDEMLNRIHSSSVYATLSNFHGIPTDCPHREQNGWTGDALISCEQSLMNFDMISAYRKWLLDFKDVQRPSGQIPGIVPTSSWGYNWGSGPAWDSALIQIPLAIYELKGDISIAELMWENMELYMVFLRSMADEYLIDYGLGDHCPPVNAKVPPIMLTETAWYYADALAMAKLAHVMRNAKEAYYSDLAAKIKKAFRDKFIIDGEVIHNESQTAIACAIYQGLLEEKEIPAAAARLAALVREKGNHMDCGIQGIKFIFSALSDNGYAETAYDFVVNPEYPSYAHWINSGMTTLCEQWEMTGSLNHHMFSEVDYWFYKHLAGIRPGKPGFETVDIAPCFVEKIGWVKASHKGIEVYWDSEKLVLTTPVPANVYIGGTCHKAAPGKHEFRR